jgi:hypothetical protein
VAEAADARKRVPALKKGVVNTVNSMTTLVGTLTDPILKLDNNGTGPALQLEAGADQPPLVVNADAGTATNLDADTLDTLNSTDFAAAYKGTVVVSPVGTDAQNGTALFNALSDITDASATQKYLLYIEPGTYDLGSNSLQMKQHVDIQGAGELQTIIRSQISTPTFCSNVGTVRGASNAELRFLTVSNTGAEECDVGIFNSGASPRLTHVTVENTGAGAVNIGVLNQFGASPTMTNVTATASGAINQNYGVYNKETFGEVPNSSNFPTIKQSKLSGTTNSLWQSDGTAKIALTQLVGPIRKDSGTLQCFNNYDENLAAVSCP